VGNLLHITGKTPKKLLAILQTILTIIFAATETDNYCVP